ncbi:uncharacterized protein LOC128673502 isoform X2 [Plodia interpunctella]|uniref:uncharacterized protein LOC128673502 isoform X2 n=1 Tax=Plodia interpunctella TaxID=58824 RepID=UPI002367570B|nr:uncharacterized protein LOC128673502 isoform X2 [Plodia interpunctella]
MMGTFWVLLFVALTGSQFGCGLPVGSTPETYPHNEGPFAFDGWDSGWYAVPALMLTLTAVGLLFGCTWCYRHKDCKPNEGADNQLFAASATHLHDVRISQPPDSGFSEPVNNNISEDNNNGPISLREMQNIANNNAAAYIVSENEERNRVSRESVVEFEPLPTGLGVADPLEHCADWFGDDDFPRSNLQYLREIGRGWFGRVVEGEIEQGSSTSSVAVKILNQNATLEQKARFLNEGRLYRDVRHENLLAFIAKCVNEEPWIMIYELCSMDLQQYLEANRPKMAILNDSGVPLRLMCDVTAALAHLHSIGYLYGELWSGSVLVRGAADSARAVLGRYSSERPAYDCQPPEMRRENVTYCASSEVWSLGSLVWVICAWGAPPPHDAGAAPDLPCPYRNHLYQVIQLCWNRTPSQRPSSAQVQALLQHLASSRRASNDDDDFEERWQRLKPNTIPVLDEHVAIIHAPSTSSQSTSHFTEPTQDTLSVDMDTAVSRSSSIMSDKDPLSQYKSESLTNLHGSLEDVRNIYLTHNEMAVLECHQGNIGLEDREKEHDRSDSSVDPWLKDIIAGSQDDVSYYRDVSDVIKNLDNILNSEKTSSSESSHQASPSRDNLSLDCKKDYPMQSSMVKSPGITNFQNILAAGLDSKSDSEAGEDEELDRDTIGTLSHSFERHSDTTSQQTLENITPITPVKDFNMFCKIESRTKTEEPEVLHENTVVQENTELPEEEIVISVSEIPKLKELCVASIPSLSDNEKLHANEDCETPCDNVEERTDKEIETKSVDDIEQTNACITPVEVIEPVLIQNDEQIDLEMVQDQVLPELSEPHLEEKHKDPVFISVEPSIPEAITTETNEVDEKRLEQVQKTIEGDTIIKDVKTVTNDLIIAEITECEKQSKSQEVVLDNDKPKLSELDLISTIIQTPESVQNINSQDLVKAIQEENENTKDNENIIEITDVVQDVPISTEIVQDIIKNTYFEQPVHTSTENGQNIIYTDAKQDTNTEIEQIIKDTGDEKAVVITSEADLKSSKLEHEIEITEVEQVENEQSSNKHTETPILPPDTVQNNDNKEEKVEDITLESHRDIETTRSDLDGHKEESSDSTVYMDLINNTNKELVRNSIDSNIKEALQSCTPLSAEDCTLVKNDSTVYLDLPSTIKETDNFLQNERMSSQKEEFKDGVISSTPKGSDRSEDTLEGSVKANEADKNELLSETKVLECASGVTAIKFDQKYVPDSLSPYESPTKSHHTDTYDENSSVVLGPFENCTMELFKGIKSIDIIDLPKEELLAFSSNFSEMNLATPSPLRDVNFLNEVPDIVHDNVQFDDLDSISEPKRDLPTDNTDSAQSATEKLMPPSTPPNSPGNFLASTSQQKYLVDIDLDPPPPMEEDIQKEIELNQIELQITTKLAMAENENNMNIEYSGPLTVVGVVSEDSMVLHDSDAVPESLLAGNGGSVEDLRANLTLDEECVKALRNELELKLPLAQVSSIEPQLESESEEADVSSTSWDTPLPPPELILGYPGALSPIAEETRQQLSAYENDAHWNASIRTDSSESYPEPCNNSTDEVTSLPWAAPGLEPATYTIHNSPNHTYTVHADTTSKEITMSADSLNASPKKPEDSPVDDRTYTKHDDEKSKCERISQVSPFLLSPTTDTSAPEDTGTAVSTLSRTTVPTDAKSSKPSETQCLSKATSIDSWCSNDTLYNVEENFDDLAMDPDGPLDFEHENQDSESSDTLTHNDDKELSHCSTYIVHDSKSEAETFSPDSITANDNNTYTKAKTEGATPVITKSDVDSKTKDLAYETLMSGLPSYSNCTTEMLSAEHDIWKLPQPELVRRSPIGDLQLSPPRPVEETTYLDDSPKLGSEPCIKKMDSVEITCLHENVMDSHNQSEGSENQGCVEENESPNSNYKSMAPSVTSTPITEPGVSEDAEEIPMSLPGVATTPEISENVPNFQVFLQSAEIRPQDISPNASNEYPSNQDTEVLLEGDSKTLSRNSNRDSVAHAERTPTYSDFESSAASKPQDVHSRDKSSLSLESGVSSEDFYNFESSVRNRPQDLSSVIDASSLLLKSERRSSELAAGSSTNVDLEHTSQNGSHSDVLETPVNLSPPNHTNLTNAHNIVPVSNFLINLDEDDENEQPHSIIITESQKEVPEETPKEIVKESPNGTFDSHTGVLFPELNNTYDSHEHRTPKVNIQNDHDDSGNSPGNCNGTSEDKNSPNINNSNNFDHENEKTETKDNNTQPTEQMSPKNDLSNELLSLAQPENALSDSHKVSSVTPIEENSDGIKCNGSSEKYATVQFLNETFEELVESNVDDDKENIANEMQRPAADIKSPNKDKTIENKECSSVEVKTNGVNENGFEDKEVASVTENFLQNEKNYCQMHSYLPLLNDIRFTGPASSIMSTSFVGPADARDCAADLLKDWDSESDDQSSNSSSGEFIWKDSDGHETPVVTTTHFDHRSGYGPAADGSPAGAGSCSGQSGSGSEGDEVEFVPSSWDCRAAPAKSALRSQDNTPDNKKRVVFKRQKYHCVYEYPREAAEVDAAQAYLPDLSTYTEWDPTSAEEAELGYGQLFGANTLDLYPLRAGIAFGTDYDEDFFISSSARPFESLGIMSTTSQFFPGMHLKPSLLRHDDFPPPPSPLPTTLTQSRTPSLDFTTPDSGVEDITPGSTSTDEDFKTKKLPEPDLQCWKPVDSGSSSESVSPSSPGGEALGGLRHTRDKLKLDLPPSPHLPSPRHNRVFNFVLDKPKRHRVEEISTEGTTPLVMTDETPIVTTSLPLQKDEELPLPEPTFSTFGKCAQKTEPEQKIILTDEEVTDSPEEEEPKVESPNVVEAVKGEGTVLDSGDEDSGIESSSKATLERKTTPNVS